MKIVKLDASLVCFAAVMLVAIPVAALRAKTYSVGYDLADLKKIEREQTQKNIELQFELASQQRAVREKYLGKNGSAAQLTLPKPSSVLHEGVPTSTTSAQSGKSKGTKE